MGGMFGGSSANTDRGNQLAATQGQWDVFGYGLPEGKSQMEQGKADLGTAKSTLGSATDYWRKLLSAGRADTMFRAAPAVSQVLEDSKAVRDIEGTFGTDRTGGTVAANREAGERTQSRIDEIINKTLNIGQAEGARGVASAAEAMAGIGGTELRSALSLLGFGKDAIDQILNNATQSREMSYKINRQAQEDWGSAAGTILKTLGIF